MVSGPTTGASENSRAWASRPALAKLVRFILFVAPIVVGWFSIKLTGAMFLRPAGWSGTALWVAQAMVVATATAHLTKGVAQRFAPMSTLLNMTMVFPDHAPSRFGVTLRSGSLKKLTPEQLILSDNTQEAAEQAMALVAELGRHEPRTRGHTERVRTYAELIGREMGLSEDDLNRLRWGVLLHDVGKLKVPARILNSTERPTEDEWRILQQHPVEGQKILRPLDSWLGEWALVAVEHHERWDGGGYPAGLEAEEISLGGRIAAVADAFDVITSKRSYKNAMSHNAAREELVRCAGEQFDPVVVKAFLRIGLDERRRSLGFLGWLFELPTLLKVTGSVASAAPTTISATATVATALSVSVASMAGVGAAEAPVAVAFGEPVVVVVDSVETQTTSLPDPAVVDRSTFFEADTTGGIVAPTTTSATVTRSTTTTTTLPSVESEPTTTASQAQMALSSASTTVTPAPPEVNVTTTTLPPATTTSAPPPTSIAEPATTTSEPAAAAPPPPPPPPPPPTSTTTTTTTTVPPGPDANPDWAWIPTNKDRRILVLDNDQAGDDPLDQSTLRIVVPPEFAKSYHVHNDHIHYKAKKHEVVDTLTYEICDFAGLCDQTNVTITVYKP